MEINQLLKRKSRDIIGNAVQALGRAHLQHYEMDGAEKARLRLESLCDVMARCLSEKSATPIIRHAESIARMRFASGFGLHEVQTSFNALEEAIWLQVLADLEPTEFFEAMGLVSTLLGVGKDALARTYASLATGSPVPSLALREMIEETNGRQSA